MRSWGDTAGPYCSGTCWAGRRAGVGIASPAASGTSSTSTSTTVASVSSTCACCRDRGAVAASRRGVPACKGAQRAWAGAPDDGWSTCATARGCRYPTGAAGTRSCGSVGRHIGSSASGRVAGGGGAVGMFAARSTVSLLLRATHIEAHVQLHYECRGEAPLPNNLSPRDAGTHGKNGFPWTMHHTGRQSR